MKGEEGLETLRMRYAIYEDAALASAARASPRPGELYSHSFLFGSRNMQPTFHARERSNGREEDVEAVGMRAVVGCGDEWGGGEVGRVKRVC